MVCRPVGAAQEAKQCLALVPAATLRAAMTNRSNALQGGQG